MDYKNYIIRFTIKLIFGIVCYYIAKKKNKDKNIAFAVGFILGIFALAYYLFFAGRKSYSEGGGYVKCKECGEIFVDTKLFCPSCKKKVGHFSIKKIK